MLVRETYGPELMFGRIRF